MESQLQPNELSSLQDTIDFSRMEFSVSTYAAHAKMQTSDGCSEL